MAYTITPSEDEVYIVLKVTGNINRELALKYNLQSHAVGRQLGINKYLMDLTECRNVETIIGNYDFAYQDMQHTPNIDRSARVAVLVSPDDHSHDFIETVAQNSGLLVRLFRDRDEAVKYLLTVKS